jgi:hypothetical protein
MTLLSKAHGFPRLRQAKITRTTRYQLLAAFSEPDLTTIVAFCAIGLLITINVILRFPDLGILIETYNKF